MQVIPSPLAFKLPNRSLWPPDRLQRPQCVFRGTIFGYCCLTYQKQVSLTENSPECMRLRYLM
jgi:hypothetical protein